MMHSHVHIQSPLEQRRGAKPSPSRKSSNNSICTFPLHTGFFPICDSASQPTVDYVPLQYLLLKKILT